MALPIIEELSGLDDPWHVARQLSSLPHLLFLDSADRTAPAATNRYSFVAADPVQWIESRTDDPDAAKFAEIQALLNADRFSDCPVPFPGGIAGLFGFDLAHQFERLPRPRLDEFRTPDLAVGVYDWVIGWDHVTRRSWIVSTGAGNKNKPAHAKQRLEQVRNWLKRPVPERSLLGGPVRKLDAAYEVPDLGVQVYSSFPPNGYQDSVRRAIDYIAGGDCFQVNLAQRLTRPGNFDGIELYGKLRRRNPSPFAGYLATNRYAIASASPERFLCVAADGSVSTRPIKGTRRRLADPVADNANQSDLLTSAKDRAENVMIVDLLRNDLGKVCAYRSIHVAATCALESYRTVHHLVSEVVGKLRPGRTALDLLQAAFPGGSVTGAPKIRAMEIIAELEPTARGPYCGSLGYLAFDGSMDSNILIRTITLGGGWAQFPVGAGIVADSDPNLEYDETIAKAEGLLRAFDP